MEPEYFKWVNTLTIRSYLENSSHRKLVLEGLSEPLINRFLPALYRKTCGFIDRGLGGTAWTCDSKLIPYTGFLGKIKVYISFKMVWTKGL